MTDTKEMNITLGFEMGARTWFTLASAGALLVSGILLAIAMGAGWANFEIFGTQADYEMTQVGVSGSNTEYSSEDLDGFEGVGMLRAGGPLVLTGMIVMFVGALAMLAVTFVRIHAARLITAGIVGLGAVAALVGLILFPIGVDAFHGDFWTQAFGQSPELSWGAGLILAVLGVTLAIGGTVAAFFGVDYSTFQGTEVDLD